MIESATTKLNPMRFGESSSLLYQIAARNLREYHGVPSMTAGSLEKTMYLLQLRPGRLVVQGIASQKLLEAETTTPDNIVVDSSSSSSSSSEIEEENEEVISNSSRNSSSTDDNDDSTQDDRSTKDGRAPANNKRPIHASLVAAGIKLRPRETRPLLRALGVRPHRLVKLGLVQRETLLLSRHRG
ncbi:unnamed protein product, partial [Pylaiella littoralis]